MRISTAVLTVLILAVPVHADDLADCSQRIDPQQTIDGCTRVLGRATLDDRQMAMVLNNRANAYGAVAAYDLAIADYDQAISIDPIYSHGYFNRGATHLEAGRTELAIADFDRALQIDPGLVQAFVNRGLARLEAGLPDQAIDDFSAALALEPHSAIAYNNRGVAYRRNGRLAEAITDFEMAVALDAAYLQAARNLSDTRNQLAPREAAEANHQGVVATQAARESIRRSLLLEPDVK
jgi:tetratricopeptide (TPR) repeat protein